MVSIVIETDGQPPRTLRVERFPCRIGRARDADVVLSGWRVGRVHSELHRIERGLRLVDAGTLGGTWVNGERIVEYAPLVDVDEVVIAGYRLRVINATPAGMGEVRSDRESMPDGMSSRPRNRAPLEAPGDPADSDPHARARTGRLVRAGAVSHEHADAEPAWAEGAGRPVDGSADREPGSATGQGMDDRPVAAPPGNALPGGPVARVSSAISGPAFADPSLLEWRRLLHRRLLQTVDLRRKDIRQLSPEQLRAETRKLLEELIADEVSLPGGTVVDALLEEVLDEAIGLGPLERLLSEPAVSEIMVNAPDAIYVERAGRLFRTPLAFSGEQAVRSVIDRIVAPLGRRIDESSPMVDARLPDGSRVNAIVPPLAVRGAAITIRRFNRQVFAPSDLVRMGSASAPMVDFLRLCVVHRRNIVISGGTGSGKTTLLNVLSNLVPEDDRIVTIEDAAELRLDHEHLVSLEARPPNAEGRGAIAIRDLVRNALRMRPDRIVVGECRGGEALDMLQAMNTGHDGSLTTVHANSPRDVIARLETMVLMAGMDLPVAAIRDQVASAVHVIVQQTRAADGRRRIVEIAEVTGLEGSRVLMQPIFRWERGAFTATGAVPLFIERLRAAGESVDWDWNSGEDR